MCLHLTMTFMYNEAGVPDHRYTVLGRGSGGSSVGQNKLLQLILGYIYILKHLQSNFIGKILFF